MKDSVKSLGKWLGRLAKLAMTLILLCVSFLVFINNGLWGLAMEAVFVGLIGMRYLSFFSSDSGRRFAHWLMMIFMIYIWYCLKVIVNSVGTDIPVFHWVVLCVSIILIVSFFVIFNVKKLLELNDASKKVITGLEATLGESIEEIIQLSENSVIDRLNEMKERLGLLNKDQKKQYKKFNANETLAAEMLKKYTKEEFWTMIQKEKASIVGRENQMLGKMWKLRHSLTLALFFISAIRLISNVVDPIFGEWVEFSLLLIPVMVIWDYIEHQVHRESPAFDFIKKMIGAKTPPPPKVMKKSGKAKKNSRKKKQGEKATIIINLGLGSKLFGIRRRSKMDEHNKDITETIDVEAEVIDGTADANEVQDYNEIVTFWNKVWYSVWLPRVSILLLVATLFFAVYPNFNNQILNDMIAAPVELSDSINKQLVDNRWIEKMPEDTTKVTDPKDVKVVEKKEEPAVENEVTNGINNFANVKWYKYSYVPADHPDKDGWIYKGSAWSSIGITSIKLAADASLSQLKNVSQNFYAHYNKSLQPHEDKKTFGDLFREWNPTVSVNNGIIPAGSKVVLYTKVAKK